MLALGTGSVNVISTCALNDISKCIDRRPCSVVCDFNFFFVEKNLRGRCVSSVNFICFYYISVFPFLYLYCEFTAQEKVNAFFLKYIFILGMSTTVSNTTFVKKIFVFVLFDFIFYFVFTLPACGEWKV